MGSTFGSQPVEFISTVTTMNATDASTSLKETEAALLQNVEKTTGVWRVREGCAKVNGANALFSQPYGLGMFDPIDSDTPQYCAVVNSTFYAGATFPLTNKTLSLTTATQMQLLSYEGVMLVNDPVKGVAVYDGAVAGWAGCASPQESSIIDSFEATTNWSTSGGVGTVSTVQFNVTQGRNSVKFKANAGSDWLVLKPVTSVNLTTFPAAPVGDGQASTVLDYIHLRVTRSYRSDFSSCTLYLYTNAGNTQYYSVVLSDLQEWLNEYGSGKVFDLFIRKSAFTSTSGNWATVQGVGFRLTSATGVQPWILCDLIELVRSGPIAREMAKTIADFESDETWHLGTFDTIYKKTLSRSLTLVGSGASADRTVTMDLTTFDHGAPTVTTDSIEIAIAKSGAKTGASVQLRFYYDSTHYYYYSFAATLIKTPVITANLYKKLADTSTVFTTIQKRLDEFSNSGGTPNWATITKVELVDSGAANDWYIDSVKLVKTKDKKLVVAFESGSTTETYSLTLDGVATPFSWADTSLKSKTSQMVRTDEGSTTALVVDMKGKTVAVVDIALSADVDCTVFLGGGTVQDQDLIGPWVWFEGSSKHVSSIDILYDTNDGNFTDYYIKTISKEVIAAASANQKDFWLKARYQKNEHQFFGSVGTWATVCKVRVQITSDATGSSTVALDQLNVERSDVLNGSYWYRVRYKNSRGSLSEYSIISNKVDVKNASILLTNVPCSTGLTREVERIGGQLTYWAKVGEMADDDTTYFLDQLSDDTPGPAVDEGKTYGAPWAAKAICVLRDKVVLANLTGPDGNRYKDAVMVGKEYSVDEFDPLDIFQLGKDDGYSILAVVPWNDRVYAFKEKGIYSFDPYNLTQKPVQISQDFGICGSFAYAVADNGIAWVTPNKELYYYDGSRMENLGHIKSDQGGSVQSYLTAIPDGYVGLVCGVYYRNFILFSVAANSGTTNSVVLAFYVPARSWTVFSGWTVSSWFSTNFAGNGKLLMGWYDTYLYQAFSGDDDAGVNIVGTIRTPDWGDDPTLKKQPGTFTIAAAAVGTTPTILIEPWYDLVDSGVDTATYTVATTFDRKEYGLRAAGTAAVFIGLKLTLTKRSRIFYAAMTRREEGRR